MPTELKRAGKDGGEGESRKDLSEANFAEMKFPYGLVNVEGQDGGGGEKKNFARERAPKSGSKGRERGKRGREIALHAASWERQRARRVKRASEGSRSVVAPEGVDGGERKGQRGSQRAQPKNGDGDGKTRGADSLNDGVDPSLSTSRQEEILSLEQPRKKQISLLYYGPFMCRGPPFRSGAWCSPNSNWLRIEAKIIGDAKKGTRTAHEIVM